MLARDVVEHMKRALTITQSDDAGAVDVAVTNKLRYRGDQLVEVRPHAELTKQRAGTLSGVRAGCPFVVTK